MATPAFSGDVSVGYCQSIIASTLMCLAEDIHLELLALEHNSLIPLARNILLKDALKRGADDILWIDADMVWDPQDLIRILKHPQDVVGIPCRKKIPKNVEFNFQLIPGKSKPDKNGVLEVHNLGTGFLKMSGKAARYLFDSSRKYIVKDQEISNAFEMRLENGLMTSEDYTACIKLKEGGFPIHMDTTLSCGHIGSFVYTADCAHFLEHFNTSAQDTSKCKAVVGLTTTPRRLSKIGPTLMSLINQSRPADRIILSLADKIARTGEEFEQIPQNIQNLVDQGKIEIHRTKDYGPATKFVGLMEVEKDPEAFLIWCDDDMQYNENMIWSMLSESSIRPNSALSAMAFDMKEGQSYSPVVRNGSPAEILEGFGGVICRVKDMPAVETWKPATPEQFAAMAEIDKAKFLGDDFVVSYALRKKGTNTLALDTLDLNRINNVVVRDVDAGPDALKFNKHTGSNLNSYALIKKSVLST